MTKLPSIEEARSLGAKLTAVDEALLKPLPVGKRRWFHGGEQYLEVTLDEDDAGVIMLEVCVRDGFGMSRSPDP